MADVVQTDTGGNKQLAKRVMEAFSRYKSERDSFYMPSWRSAAEWICPRKSSILGFSEKSPGNSGWVDNLFDITGMKASERLAAWLMTNTSPANARWLGLTSSPRTRARLKQRISSVDQWWQQVTDITLEQFQISNFYTQKHEALLDRNNFGTATLATRKGRRVALNFQSLDVGTYVIGADDEGYIDTVIREFQLNARQAVQQFGLESLGPKLTEAYREESKQQTKFTFFHSVAPNIDRDPNYDDSLHKPYKSCYVCKEDEWTVQEGGYDEMPYAVSRFLSWSGDTWGWAPAFTALPTIRETNFFKMQASALAELSAFPPMAYPDNLDGVLDLRAGAKNIYDHNQPEAFPRPLYEPKQLQLSSAQFILESNRKDINDVFYGDVIAMFSNLEREITAFEASQLAGEKLDIFSPYYFRLINEMDTPTVQRAFSILLAEGFFPDPPAELLTDNGDGTAHIDAPEVVYLSRLALAIQAHEIQSFDALLQRYQLIASVDPAAAAQFIKPIDLQKAGSLFARNLGLPVSIQRSDEELKQINQDESDAAEQQAAAQQAPPLAKAAKDADAMSEQGKQQLAQMMGVRAG